MKAKKAMKAFICILIVVLAVSLTACESGTVQSGSSTTNATGGVLHGSFLCFECKETQQFEIETTQN